MLLAQTVCDGLSQPETGMFSTGCVAAFHFFGGVPPRITYENLKTAVKKVLIGSERQEQGSFIVFSSHYLFESHYCSPAADNEKGRVEDGVGYARRNFMSPLLWADNFEQLNEQLRRACLEDDQRRIHW
jgi:transposase